MPPATSSKPSKRTTSATSPAGHLPVVHKLHALLHTMRAIEGHEEHLCSLMHHIQTTGQITPTITRELRLLLDRLPSLAYQADLDALQKSLDPPAKVAARSSRKPA